MHAVHFRSSAFKFPAQLQPCALHRRPVLLMHQAYKRDTPLAEEYHNCDFDWASLKTEVQHVVERQESIGKQVLAAKAQALQHTNDSAQVPQPSQPHFTVEPLEPVDAVCTQSHSSNGTAVVGALDTQSHTSNGEAVATLDAGVHNNGVSSSRRQQRKQARLQQRQQQQQEQQQNAANVQSPVPGAVDGFYEGNKWDEFYGTTARSMQFFRERRYLLKEFPVLADGAHTKRIVELGCGAGASLIPVMRSHPMHVVATDISPTSLEQLRAVAKSLEQEMPGVCDRLRTFVADSADPDAASLLQGLQADAALIMFTLSAVTPLGQAHMLANAFTSLRPGGYLCIRDHGLFDMVQLRIPPEQWIGPNMYKRGDGTLAYFFSVEDMQAKATVAGFETLECEYVTVYNTNRKTGLRLRRVFVHALLRKPDS